MDSATNKINEERTASLVRSESDGSPVIKHGTDAGKTEQQLHDEIFSQSPLDYFKARCKYHGIGV